MGPKMLLRDPEDFPADRVLERALGEDIYNVLRSLLDTLTGPDYGLIVEWRFYNDGKAWLGKVTSKKKTVMWLSVWEGFFKASFYFTEKHREVVASLSIPDSIKEQFARTAPCGRLIPMIIDISRYEQIDGLLNVVRLKMKA